jgi:hypothetical protein
MSQRSFDLSPPLILLKIKINAERRGSPTFVWEPQKAFSSAPQNIDLGCILSLKSYPESFR